jgi:hypothetical protein
MATNARLFRAIVVLGASLTAGACDDEPRCARCVPEDAAADAVASTDANATSDAPGPTDAMVEAVLIL